MFIWDLRCSQTIWRKNCSHLPMTVKKQMGPTLQPGPKRRSLMLIYLMPL